MLLVACGSKNPAAPTAPTAPAGPVELPSGPPYATPGERMSYRIQLQGLEIAAMTFGVGEPTEVAGTQAIVVQGHAKSVGLANMVAAVDDTFTSWIDVTSGRSVRWQSDEFETNSKTNVEHTIVEMHAREGDIIPVTFHMNDATPVPEPQKASTAVVWDYNAFLIALRGWEGAPGTKTGVEVFRGRWMWHVDVTIKGRETLTTELGELPALRFDAHTYKLARDGSKYPDTDERDFTVWISDDEGRVPLQVTARTDYGDVKMQIVEYVPGTGTRLAP